MTDTRIPVPGEVWTHKKEDYYPVLVDAVTDKGVMYLYCGPCARGIDNFLADFNPPSRPIPPAPADRDAMYFAFDENGNSWGNSWGNSCESTLKFNDRSDVLRVPLAWDRAEWVTR